MRKYECIKPLELEHYDEDGYRTGDTMTIPINTGWEVDEDSYKMISGKESIRLIQITNDNHGRWIEIHEDTLSEHFMKLD